MIAEERIVYLTLGADGSVGTQSRDVRKVINFGGLDDDEVLLRIIGRRIRPQGPFKPISVEIIA